VTNAETYSATYLYSLDSDGFTLGSSGGVNASTDNYVAWCWKAGGAAVSNSDGSITSQVSANQDAGFSIVSYTGTGSAGTVGHGLGKNPGKDFQRKKATYFSLYGKEKLLNVIDTTKDEIDKISLKLKLPNEFNFLINSVYDRIK
ncbi:MAG: hypothetical protein EBW04_04130, partial [Betaproteobacteria bacterium]|nr:hypothetical protein [Betaproteobacteria bacterium]